MTRSKTAKRKLEEDSETLPPGWEKWKRDANSDKLIGELTLLHDTVDDVHKMLAGVALSRSSEALMQGAILKALIKQRIAELKE